MPSPALSKTKSSQLCRAAGGTAQNTEQKRGSLQPRAVAEVREKRTNENQTETEEKKQQGMSAPRTHVSSPAAAQPMFKNLRPDKVEIMTLSLVFERDRELNKDEKFTRRGKKKE